ncbi:MAG: hypothetical protein HY747_10745 [Elusimicrobia bacterium]|nr:hypothetical protein [Elusimicrobiota bacterium]
MTVSTHQQQNDLLQSLSQMGSAGRAEGEDVQTLPKRFYPVEGHLRAFDPDVVLIIGPRGAGKTQLFRAICKANLLPAIAKRFPRLRMPPPDTAHTRLLVAYPIEAKFPDMLELRRFAENSTHQDFLELWFAYLVRLLRDDLSSMSGLSAIFDAPASDAQAVLDAFRKSGNAPTAALDGLDATLVNQDRHIYILYDELDTLGTLGGSDWKTVHLAVQGLVAFWANYARRWRCLRPKIFLRTDLYQRVGAAAGADFAKLAANRVEIFWSDHNLYAMLVKRIANTSEDLLAYCREAGILFDDDSDLGQVPKIEDAGQVKPLIGRMISQYMGASRNKGLTFRWLLDHIRDGRGQALPRPLVRLIESASDVQRNASKQPRWPTLIEPGRLRRALDKASQEHVMQSVDEWGWLGKLGTWLSNDPLTREVPWERRQAERVLEKSWATLGGGENNISLPADSARDLVGYLIEVGIFRERYDGRLDVPDLFLFGLGLKRKGGVARR